MAAVPFSCGQNDQAAPGVLPVPSILSVLTAGVSLGAEGALWQLAGSGYGLLAPGGGRYSVAAKGCLVEEALP